MTETTELIHATSIFLNGYGVFITGSSGIGKSALALDLLNDAHGFDFEQLSSRNNLLVADDQTLIGKKLLDNIPHLVAHCPKNIEGLFEVRGLGLIKLPFKSPAPMHLFVEIIDGKPARMPEAKQQTRTLLGVDIAYIQIYKNDRYAKARVRAALFAHTRAKLET